MQLRVGDRECALHRAVATVEARVGAGDESGEEVRLHERDAQVGERDQHVSERLEGGAVGGVVDARHRNQAHEHHQDRSAAERGQHGEPGQGLVGLQDRPRALGDLPRGLESMHGVQYRRRRGSGEGFPAPVRFRRVTSSTFRAPGRVNLMGDHTDYQGGFVLPVAIDRACTVEVRPGAQHGDAQVVRARSRELPGEVVIPVDLPGDRPFDPRTVEPAWGRFVAGVITALTARGATVPPLDLAIASTVPAGSGLSSSTRARGRAHPRVRRRRASSTSTASRSPRPHLPRRWRPPACPAG